MNNFEDNDEAIEAAEQAIIAEFEAAKAAGDMDGIEAALDKGLHLMADQGGIPLDQITGVLNFVNEAINMELRSLIRQANEFGLPVVPVAVLEELITLPKLASTAMWNLLDRVDGALAVPVPDDISELFGEG